MAILHIPDKYAQERGGWKTDHVMKKVYQNTFSSERKKVDSIIDAYFDKAMQHEMQHEKKKPSKYWAFSVDATRFELATSASRIPETALSDTRQSHFPL